MVGDNGSLRLESRPSSPQCTLGVRQFAQVNGWAASFVQLVPLHHTVVRRSRGQEEVSKTLATISTLPYKCLMSSKEQNMTSKRGQASEEPAHSYDHDKFINESGTEKFGLISKNRSFIKDKGFHHLDDFFHKTIPNKGWWELCQPPNSVATSVIQEFYANLASHVLKKVRVRGVLVDFSAKSINRYYNLESVTPEAFDRLHEQPNYLEVLTMLTNGHDEWKLNNKGHAVHFKAKHLAYIPKVLNHFITSCLIPKINVCEVTAKRALLNYAIIEDIPFDVGQVIEDVILYNKDAKMNLGYPFLIYSLCK